MADYFSFEDVIGELKVSEEDLKRMVSEGELRAFRDENKMKFKKEDVENLKKGRVSEPTIILPTTPGAGAIDDTVLDLDIGHETSALSETSAPTIELSDPSMGETGSGSQVNTQEIGLESDETFIEEDMESTGLSTEPLSTVEEPLEPATIAEEASSSEMRRSRRVSAQVPVALEEELERQRAHPGWTYLAAASMILSLISTLVIYDTVRMDNGRVSKPLGLSAGMGNMFLGQFWGDAEWEGHVTNQLPSDLTEADKEQILPIGWYGKPSFELPHDVSAGSGTAE